MKKIVNVVLIILVIYACDQKKSFNDRQNFSCEHLLNNKIIDSSLYDILPNGKLIFAPYRNKSKIYKVTFEDSNFNYYVSDSVANIIKRSIKENNCSIVKIERLNNSEKHRITRD